MPTGTLPSPRTAGEAPTGSLNSSREGHLDMTKTRNNNQVTSKEFAHVMAILDQLGLLLTHLVILTIPFLVHTNLATQLTWCPGFLSSYFSSGSSSSDQDNWCTSSISNDTCVPDYPGQKISCFKETWSIDGSSSES